LRLAACARRQKSAIVSVRCFPEGAVFVSITRRKFVSASSLSVAAIGLGRVPLLGQQPAGQPAQPPAAQTPPVTKFEEIRRGVGYFTGTGGTIGYVVNGDGAIAVDSQFMPSAEICVAGLKQKAPKGIELLINTHHHGDHTSGNPAFKGAVKRIVAHENCVAWHRKVAEQAGTAAQQAFADTTFKDAWKVDFGGETVHARYFGPGHTSGDAVIFFEKANVIHGGDLLFRRVHPRVDGPAGASVVNWAAILDKMASAHDNETAFVFGHGKDGLVLGKKADVVFFRDYLAAALDHVRRGIKAGQSREEIAKTPSLKGFEDVAQVNPRITLAGVLEASWDELTKK
jgi:glyoxylase-like metal-dependent hydrolase (beta-lactamase superfamily II)